MSRDQRHAEPEVQQNKLLFILSGQSIGESLRRMQYLREYSKWQKEQAAEIKRQNERSPRRRR